MPQERTIWAAGGVVLSMALYLLAQWAVWIALLSFVSTRGDSHYYGEKTSWPLLRVSDAYFTWGLWGSLALQVLALCMQVRSIRAGWYPRGVRADVGWALGALLALAAAFGVLVYGQHEVPTAPTADP